MTVTDPMLELFNDGVTDVRVESATGQAAGLAGLLTLFIAAVSVVGAAVTTVVMFAVVAAPLLPFAAPGVLG